MTSIATEETIMTSIATEETTMTSNTDDDPTCGICYTDLTTKNTVVTPCNHSYCSTCFFAWLGRKDTCALCRQTLLSNTIAEERFETLQAVQNDLLANYRYRRVLKKNIKKMKKNEKILTDNVLILQSRQIRIRELLDETTETCRQTIADSIALKEAAENQQGTLQLLNSYKQEWDDLYTPSKKEEESEEKLDDETTGNDNAQVPQSEITAMMQDLARLLRAERRSIRRMDRSNMATLNNIRNPLRYQTIPQANSDMDLFEGQITDDNMPAQTNNEGNISGTDIYADMPSLEEMVSSDSENETTNNEIPVSENNTQRRRVVLPHTRRQRVNNDNSEGEMLFIPTTNNDGVFSRNRTPEASTGGTSHANNTRENTDTTRRRLFARHELMPSETTEAYNTPLQAHTIISTLVRRNTTPPTTTFSNNVSWGDMPSSSASSDDSDVSISL